MGEPARSDDSVIVVWEPKSKPQAAYITCPVFEIFFGGSRGSLKTDGSLGDWLSHADLYGENAIGLMVRRERTQLVETYERAKKIYLQLGFKFNDSDSTCRSPNGARMRFAHLERDQDAEAYQGHSYSRVYVEELGNFPSPDPVMKLMATLRSAAGVPCGFRGTGNPGGPGHQWVKARYIDPAPLGWKIIKESFANPFTGEKIERERIFIPGKITDHNLLGAEYVANLQMSGSAELVKAWLEGDWSIIAGAFFPEFSLARHVIKPRALPAHWTRFRAMDWGSAKPFSVGWYAVSDGELPDIPRGCLVKYREWYGKSGINVGVKMFAEDVAEGILERDGDDKIIYSVLDPSAFAQQGGPSIAERMADRKVYFDRADNKRAGQVGAMGGWDQVRARLRGDDSGPGILFFDTCLDTIRTLPALQHDARKPEDVDTDAEDHAGDETRYACMSRPYAMARPAQMRDILAKPTLDELWEMQPSASKRIT